VMTLNTQLTNPAKLYVENTGSTNYSKLCEKYFREQGVLAEFVTINLYVTRRRCKIDSFVATVGSSTINTTDATSNNVPFELGSYMQTTNADSLCASILANYGLAYAGNPYDVLTQKLVAGEVPQAFKINSSSTYDNGDADPNGNAVLTFDVQYYRKTGDTVAYSTADSPNMQVMRGDTNSVNLATNIKFKYEPNFLYNYTLQPELYIAETKIICDCGVAGSSATRKVVSTEIKGWNSTIPYCY